MCLAESDVPCRLCRGQTDIFERLLQLRQLFHGALDDGGGPLRHLTVVIHLRLSHSRTNLWSCMASTSGVTYCKSRLDRHRHLLLNLILHEGCLPSTHHDFSSCVYFEHLSIYLFSVLHFHPL